MQSLNKSKNTLYSPNPATLDILRDSKASFLSGSVQGTSGLPVGLTAGGGAVTVWKYSVKCAI